jgi:hypothetical protein
VKPTVLQVDLYSAVRNTYLSRRHQAIAEAMAGLAASTAALQYSSLAASNVREKRS